MRHAESQPSLHRHLLGAHPLIRHYLERMNFRGIISDCLASGLRARGLIELFPEREVLVLGHGLARNVRDDARGVEVVEVVEVELHGGIHRADALADDPIGARFFVQLRSREPSG